MVVLITGAKIALEGSFAEIEANPEVIEAYAGKGAGPCMRQPEGLLWQGSGTLSIFPLPVPAKLHGGPPPG